MKNIYLLFIREIKKIIKDKNLLLMVFVAPLVYPVLYGAIYFNKVETEIPVAIVDYDNTSMTRNLIKQIDASNNVYVCKYLSSEYEAENGIINDEYHGVLIIHKNFTEEIKHGKRSNVNLILSTGRLLVLSDIGIPISQIVNTFGGKITAATLASKNVPVFQNTEYAQPIKIDFQNLYNPYLTYGDLILPPLFVIILSQLALISSAAAFAKEWALDKWKNMFLITNNTFTIGVSKVLAFVFLFVIWGIILLSFHIPAFDVRFMGKWFELLIVAVLGIGASTCFGLFWGTFFKHRISVFVILGFSSYPFFLLSGYAWPGQQIPEYLQYISYLLPITPFLKAVFSITQMNVSIMEIQSVLFNSVVLICFYFIMFCIRIRTIKKSVVFN